MKKLDSKGFWGVESLLILVIIGLIGTAGWYVYNSQKKTTATPQQNNNSAAQSCDIKSDVVDNPAYKDWETYSSPKGNVSFKHPKLSTLSWSKIADTSPAASYSEAKEGQAYVGIEGEQAVNGPESGPASIIYFLKGHPLPASLTLAPGSQVKELTIKGVSAYLVSRSEENAGGNLEFNTYYMYRPCTNDTVVMDLANNHDEYFDDAYQGIFDTLILRDK